MSYNALCQHQDTFRFTVSELADDIEIVPQDLYDSGGWAIANAKVNEFRRMTVEKTALMEVRIFGNNREIIRFG